MQGLRQLGTFLLLHRQQGLGQVGIVGLGLLQGCGHAVEVFGQLARFRQAGFAQACRQLPA
ncbi:hypothetical protein D3C76_647030 [compost metagenome]